MNRKQRLDKVLGHMGAGTRSELKRMARTGRIHVNGTVVRDSGRQIDPQADRIEVDGQPVHYRKFVYIMLNKPQGVICATEDARECTVLELLDDSLRTFDLFPVGRLDKDTEGLLLLTNDGPLAHRLLSPRAHVPKTYAAHVEGAVGAEDKVYFERGVELDDGYVTLPARLTITGIDDSGGNPVSIVELTIYEGKFHQVKRMFQTVGKRVVYLKRVRMGPLQLDPTLSPGQYRELNERELKALKGDNT